MRNLLERLTQIDKHGDSPISIAVAITTFLRQNRSTHKENPL